MVLENMHIAVIVVVIIIIAFFYFKNRPKKANLSNKIVEENRELARKINEMPVD